MMNLSRFDTSLKPNKPANSKNGVLRSGKLLEAKISGTMISIPINQLESNPDQARSHINTPELEKLKASIKREGLLHPIIVYKEERSKKYIVKAGHRRLQAIKELGFHQVECAVFTSRGEATLAAISTNEFSEAIHPIDKGIEVESLIKELSAQGIDPSMKDIAEFFGASIPSVYEWRRYAKIHQSVRAEIIKHDIRSKDFLRKVTKVCKTVEKSDLPDRDKVRVISEEVQILIQEIVSKKPTTERTSQLPVGEKESSISNFLFYERNTDEFKIRKSAIGKLSADEKARLREAASELLGML